MASVPSAKFVVGIFSLVILLFVRTSSAMNNCDTQSAICVFNSQLQGSISFYEKHGFGCSSFGDDDGLHIQISLQGFDPNDGVFAHNVRVKSFAGMQPSCAGMGPDFGQGLRGPDLGTFAETDGQVVVNDAVVKSGPTLLGQGSIVGRSLAVVKGQVPSNGQQPTEVLGCCVVGLVNMQEQQQQLPVLNVASSSGSSNSNRPTPGAGQGTGAGSSKGGYKPKPSNGQNGGGTNNNVFGKSPIRRQNAGSRFTPQSLSNSFTNSAFRSPFNVDDKFSFFDLSGKTSKVDEVLPESIQSKFQAPEPPKFKDIYGLDTGDSPLGSSGFGNSVKPYKTSKLSEDFFKGEDIRSTVQDFALSADEIDIPKESADEESSASSRKVDDGVVEGGRKNADDAAQDEYYDAEEGNSSSPSRAAAPPSAAVPPGRSGDRPQVGRGALPPGYGSSDLSQASFLPSAGVNFDDNVRENLTISQNLHNGQTVASDREGTPARPATGSGTPGSVVAAAAREVGSSAGSGPRSRLSAEAEAGSRHSTASPGAANVGLRPGLVSLTTPKSASVGSGAKTASPSSGSGSASGISVEGGA